MNVTISSAPAVFGKRSEGNYWMAKKQTVENLAALKHLFGRDLCKRWAVALIQADSNLDLSRLQRLPQQLEKLEMKARVRMIRDELRALLPDSYPKALKCLLKAAQIGEDSSRNAEQRTTRLEGFDLWPASEFVQTYGLDHLELSLKALAELTPIFSSEFAVRPYLIRSQKRTLQFLVECSQSTNVHLRRWASEGSRPRLPWGERLQAFVKDPELTSPILERLKFDSELYVRKSVSNHLNDIAKDHPEWVIRTLAKWQKQASGENVQRIDWIIARSLRTLIKNGHHGALRLVGVDPTDELKVGRLKISKTDFKMDERLDFSFEIQVPDVESKTSQKARRRSRKVIVDYIIHYVRANQTLSPKVFKLKTFELSDGTKNLIEKTHHFKAVTTRTHYSGEHRLEVQINGKVRAHAVFFLKV